MLQTGRDSTAEPYTAEEVQNSAWSCFCRSGRAQDYIRYAQLAHGRACGRADTAGGPNADEDRGADH